MALSEEARPALLTALPELVRWLTEDPECPRPVMRSLYEAALTAFTLLEDRSRATRDAMLEVLDASLSLSPLPIEYRRYLRDAATFVVGEGGTSTAYWLIELAERLLRRPASDGAARLALLNTILAALQPITGVLTVAQRAAYKRVAGMARWPLGSGPSRDADLFVIATASAKHAATDCIQRHRRAGMPVMYAAGRGVTSFLGQ